MRILKSLAGAAAVALLSFVPALAETPVVRAALQLSGTVNWEADTIRHYGFDKANGFSLEVSDVAGAPAAQIALVAGEVDMIVSDWLWVARERAAGRDFVFIPYSRAIGGLMVPADSPAKVLADLKEQKIGVAGSPIDKSWLILRAYAQKVEGFDLAGSTEQVFAAPPLVYKAALDGEVQGALNFWNFGARMQAAGMRPLLTVDQASKALGLDPEMPLVGYVLRGDVLAKHPGLGDAIAAASHDAKEKLTSDPVTWERIRPMMKAANDAEFEALKAGFLAGTPKGGAVDEKAAARMLALMAELGGADLVGDLKELPDGVFHHPGS
ncbi:MULTISPECIES: ABC transporter substrate-binding protein [unclassified Rhizobium]|uniref:ABC transporter substrate-binding protein n=1 Tax=unclassified Rhizobium TaxID=2613769 RepID=UPI000712D392|nr:MULTISPECIES: ABC transporter substrate-binding protein [unclassified Rhizobium]KQS83124.1 ABC transporter substrate-binding protein [Rhizobium sp. Leaf386]KQS88989.1 ABC transporter substrate-binding protein [Rhizobium sp. Leaf391]KQT92837.1 ABC transporter substrate-binding protein [Rhizobium sp. Leaf453]